MTHRSPSIAALTPSRVLRSVRYRRQQRSMAGPRLLRAFADAYPEAFFVEIGANDGDQHDHLRPFILSHCWSGIMVEPVPYVFERLQRNYEGLDRVLTVNVAVAEEDGELPFYRLVEPADEERASLPSWYDGIGSFSRAAIAGHVKHIPDIESRIVDDPVPSLTFESLCRRHDISRVDLILIDTEGYDARILDSIDLARHRPRLLIYEHFHLPLDTRQQCRARLERAGYDTMEEGFDTFCLDVREQDQLTRRWRRLRPAVAGVYAHDEA